jgi:hypothetical protein
MIVTFDEKNWVSGLFGLVLHALDRLWSFAGRFGSVFCFVESVRVFKKMCRKF